ncbi:hypothetical protein [Methylocystis heyeri]|uniref:hypothetical protein n=1 Tax=Methylocystis heyeri TaxID=391905 RepID=UPI001136609F|nr:hypothetical protein [Methylocystis heyeri]
MSEPENLVLQLLREMREENRSSSERLERVERRLDGFDGRMDSIDRRLDDLGAGLNSLRADVASDLMTLEKRLGDQIAGLRRAVMEYHSSRVFLYSRVSRAEPAPTSAGNALPATAF